MERTAEYIRKAVEAEENAKNTSDPAMKRQWLEMAVQWRALAEQRSRIILPRDDEFG